MRVWFYVFNHSKYRFLFHAVYIGIVNEIINPNFHVAIYNRFKGLDFDVRSSPHQSAPMAFFCPYGCNIAHGKDLASEAVAEVLQSFFENFSAADFCYRQITASCTFVCRKTFRHTKGARSARPGPLPSRDPFSSYIWIPTENR